MRRATLQRLGLGRLTLPAVVAALCAAVLQAPAAPAASSAVVAKPGYPAECPWMNTAKSADQRARTLLANSSLEQELRWLVEQPATQPTTTTFSGVSHPAQLP